MPEPEIPLYMKTVMENRLKCAMTHNRYKKSCPICREIAGRSIMAGLSASGLKTQIRSYTETDSNVLYQILF